MEIVGFDLSGADAEWRDSLRLDRDHIVLVLEQAFGNVGNDDPALLEPSPAPDVLATLFPPGGA